jgi:hypothetical protein
VAKIPKDVQLVYWDYYHHDVEFYRDWIDRHRALGSEPVMANGVWVWNHFWAALPHSLSTLDACMTACREKKLSEVFATLWGDDGMECDVFSALPGLQYFAEYNYADRVDPALLRANFRGSCDADFDDWAKAAGIDSVPGLADPRKNESNVGKWLLWQDPMLSFMDPQVADYPLKGHYAKLADELETAAGKDKLSRRLLFPARLARALALKVDLRKDLAAAYAAGDKERLKELAANDLPALRKALDLAWKTHRDMWLATYKPFGLEVIERRYGAVRTRLESLGDRLKAYLAGKVPSIPELEARFEKVHDLPKGTLPRMNWSRVATASCIK